MGAILLSKDVPGTLGSLYETIVSPGTWEHWFGIHRDFVGTPPRRLVQGSTFVSEVLLHGMSEEVEWTVSKLDAPTQISLRGHGHDGVRCDFSYWLQPCDTGTTVTASIVFSGPLITPSVSAALEAVGYDQLDCTLGQLAELAYALHS